MSHQSMTSVVKITFYKEKLHLFHEYISAMVTGPGGIKSHLIITRTFTHRATEQLCPPSTSFDSASLTLGSPENDTILLRTPSPSNRSILASSAAPTESLENTAHDRVTVEPHGFYHPSDTLCRVHKSSTCPLPLYKLAALALTIHENDEMLAHNGFFAGIIYAMLERIHRQTVPKGPLVTHRRKMQARQARRANTRG